MSKNLMLSLLAFAGDKPAAASAATGDVARGAASAMLSGDYSLFVDTGREMPRKGRVALTVGPMLAIAESVLRAYVSAQVVPVAVPGAPTGTGDAIGALWATLPAGFALPAHCKGKKTDIQRDAVRPVAAAFSVAFSALVSDGVKTLAESASIKLKAGKIARDDKKATDAAAVAATAAQEKADIVNGSIRAAGAVDLVRALGMFDPESIGSAAGADSESFECLLSLLNGVAAQRAAATAAAAAAQHASATAAATAAAAAQQSIIDCSIAGSVDQPRTIGDQYVTGTTVSVRVTENDPRRVAAREASAQHALNRSTDAAANAVEAAEDEAAAPNYARMVPVKARKGRSVAA